MNLLVFLPVNQISLSDLNSNCNGDLSRDELTAQCECFAVELMVQEVRHCTSKQSPGNNQQASSGLTTRLDRLWHQLHTRYCTPTKISDQALLEQLCSSEHKRVSAAPLECRRTNKDTTCSDYSRKKDTQSFRAQLQDWLSTQSIHDIIFVTNMQALFCSLFV